MGEVEGDEIITTIRQEIEAATEVVLCSVEECLGYVPAVRNGDSEALAQIEQRLFAILEACAFQDLTGQRLTKLQDMLSPDPRRPVNANPLLNGPALPGQGLDQAAADSLMDGSTSWPPGPNP